MKEHLNLNQKMISRATRNDDMTKENGRQPNESLKSATRGAVQASNISTLSSGDGGTDDQILASIPAAQVAPRDSRGIQALPIHIGSDPLFSIALQRALYQGLGTMNTGPRSGQFSDNADTGARSSGLENPRIPARTSHYPDTSRNSPTSMMVNNVSQFSPCHQPN